MTRSCINRLRAAGCCAIALAVGTASAAPFLPDFGAATFDPGAPIDHPYFPLLDNLTRIYEGAKEGDGEIIVERFELTLLGPGPTLLGVPTTTQRDRGSRILHRHR